MNSSDRQAWPRAAEPPAAGRAASPHARFIPREELRNYAAWRPGSFADGADLADTPRAAGHAAAPPEWHAAGTLQSGLPGLPGSAAWGRRSGDRPGAAAPADASAPDRARPRTDAAGSTAAPPANAPDPAAAQARLDALRAELLADTDRQVAAARTQGYQDGYRDGLVALDSFKQSFASQVSAQVGQVVQALDAELGQLEQQMATSLARVATELARQVVRSELSVRPALVAQVAREAVNAVLASARQITVLVHPDDHALVASGCDDALQARGARLLAQAGIQRGGCRVESDAGSVDARVAARWAQATHAMGSGVAWDDQEAGGPAPGSDA